MIEIESFEKELNNIKKTFDSITNYINEKKNIFTKKDIYREKLNKINNELNFISELYILIKKNKDLDLLEELLKKIMYLKSEAIIIKTELFFDEPYDNMESFFEIHAGSGGIDAQEWVSFLFKMYTAWFVKHKFNYKIINIINGEINGLRSISMKISGKNVFGWAKNESGIHRLVRKSPFDSNKRHTSFASVFVYPDIEKKYDFVIKESDLKIDTFRSCGAGGQHVNTTDSAVRIKHIPSGIIVKCQAERSQHKNKTQAMKQLKSKLFATNTLKDKISKDELGKKKISMTWGNQIRSYVLDKSMIKDNKTNLEIKNIDIILNNGDLDKFIFPIINSKFKNYEK